MKVIANSSPIITLSLVKKLNIFKELYGKIIIPQAVFDEIIPKDKGKYGIEEIESAIESGWIIRKKIRNRMAVEMLLSELDLGEAEAIVLAREEKANLVILDNREPRRIAKSLAFNVIGTLGVFKQAHMSGLVKNLKDILDEIKLKGFWISQDLYTEILKK